MHFLPCDSEKEKKTVEASIKRRTYLKYNIFSFNLFKGLSY